MIGSQRRLWCPASDRAWTDMLHQFQYVQGRPLAWYIKEHPRIPKKLLLEWILHLERQLEMLHKCRNHPCYQYVNPYSIIVSEEGGLYFSDMEAGSNEEMLRLMRKKNIREHFLPPGMPYYRKASVSLDAYGLGKTVQYLLAMTEADPKLNWKETGRLRKMTSHCLNQFSKGKSRISRKSGSISLFIRKNNPNIAGKSRAILAVAALLCVLAAACRVGITASRTQDAAMKSEERGTAKSLQTMKKRQMQNIWMSAWNWRLPTFWNWRIIRRCWIPWSPYRTVPQKPKH